MVVFVGLFAFFIYVLGGCVALGEVGIGRVGGKEDCLCVGIKVRVFIFCC